MAWQTPVTMGYLIWDSRSLLNCNPTFVRPIYFNPSNPNFRPATLVPKNLSCDETVWVLYDDIQQNTWPSYSSAQRNGIAMTGDDGVIYFWDVKGYTSSDESTVDSPHAKMEQFSRLSCSDCDENGSTLISQYRGNFPALPSATTYCYSFTRTDNGDPQAATLVELYYGNYITGAVTFLSRAGGVTTWRICLDRPYTSIGVSSGDGSWTLL